jgi:predicted metal-dependent peptidase
MSMKKNFKFKQPTAGVSVASDGITLHINPEFFDNLKPQERVAILEHEALHVVHAHLSRFKKFGLQDQGIANVACDLAINQFIRGLPETMQVKDPKTGEMKEGKPVTFAEAKKLIPDILPRMSSEYYFMKLKAKQEEMKKEAKDGGQGEGDQEGDPQGGFRRFGTH